MSAPDYRPPERFRGASFASYRPQTPSQDRALQEARRFAERVRRRHLQPRFLRWLRPEDELGAGLYLVGPVGTGKTHLLAALYGALHGSGDAPQVPCAFVHSSALFRATARPEDYAKALAERFDVLLLDEVELDDPASEVRLLGVLKTLRRLGVTVAATSNAEPERFVSAAFGRDRLERFLSEEFRRQYHVVFVGGEDFRQRMEKPGRAWVGPPAATHAAMQAAFDAAEGFKRWLTFANLLRLAAETERGALARELAALDALFVEGIRIRDTDDALRLLRIVDDLYAEPRPPVLYFTSEEPPAQWFAASAQHGALERGIAEKFARTTSRLAALARIEVI
ncbi:MAG TPA: AFG1/ZapE family ATPase [Rubricoccaceae bacterium]|nr:AFG1/ZapE family ATPase [Rubricoccaceae bacterium]